MALPFVEMKTPWPLINVEEDNGELVVSFHSEAFLWPSVEELGYNLLDLVDETDDCAFALDFGNVDKVIGVGLKKLALLDDVLKTRGRRLVIRNVAPDLLPKFAVAGLTEKCYITTAAAGRPAAVTSGLSSGPGRASRWPGR
jgi:hypothetical protein